jgi:serine/threonine-protein kinase
MRNVLDMHIEPPGAPTLRLDEVVLRALERDPERRFATAEEFAHASEAAARGRLASRAEVSAMACAMFEGDVAELHATLGALPIDPAPDGRTLIVTPAAPSSARGPASARAPVMPIPSMAPTMPTAGGRTPAGGFARQAGFLVVAVGMLCVGVVAVALARKAPRPSPAMPAMTETVSEAPSAEPPARPSATGSATVVASEPAPAESHQPPPAAHRPLRRTVRTAPPPASAKTFVPKTP